MTTAHIVGVVFYTGAAYLLGGILLVLATSLDGFSAGIAYGIRRVSFPLLNRTVVAAVSVLTMGAAMGLGRAVGNIFPGRSANILGGCLLMALGAWTVLRGLAQEAQVRTEEKVWSWRIPALGLVIQILHQPIEADLDASGSINAAEAIWLGLALSLDAFAAGFCANLGARLPFYLPLIVGAVNWLFLTAGISLGDLVRRERLPAMAVLPGLILALMGLLRVI